MINTVDELILELRKHRGKDVLVESARGADDGDGRYDTWTEERPVKIVELNPTTIVLCEDS